MRRNRFDSHFRYNPLNPRNWRFFCKVNVITSVLLLIDWILGINLHIEISSFPFLTKIFVDGKYTVLSISLISILIILSLSPLLNNDIDETPFFIAMLIKIIIYLGISPFTLLGQISRWILNFWCGLIIGVVLFFMVIMETEEPISFDKTMLLGLVIIGIHFLTNFLIAAAWRLEETWALIYILISLVGVLIIQKGKFLTGALTILIIGIFNDYVVSFGLSGFGTGASILMLSSVFLVFYYLSSK